MFIASGDCAEKQWEFLSLGMPQWLVVVFSVFMVIAILVLLAQFVKPKRRDLFGR